MLKVKFFLNEPNGKPRKNFKQMMPSLGIKYPIDMEVISKPKPKPKAEYMSDAYFPLPPKGSRSIGIRSAAPIVFGVLNVSLTIGK